jgi:hypothetical protein
VGLENNKCKTTNGELTVGLSTGTMIAEQNHKILSESIRKIAQNKPK